MSVRKQNLNNWAAIIILGIVASFALLKFASHKAAEIVAPGILATNENMLAVDAQQKVYLFDVNQQILAHRTLKEMHIDGTITDMQLTNTTLYIGVVDESNSYIYQCTLTDLTCSTWSAFSNVARRTFKFLIADSKVYITDTARHQLLIYNIDGTLILSARSVPVPLCYPNGLLLANNTLFVADTNNYRVAAIDLNTINPDKDKNFTASTYTTIGEELIPFWDALYSTHMKSGWCQPLADQVLGKKGDAYFERALDFGDVIPPSEPKTARQGRIWPTALSFDTDNRIWVIVGGDNLLNGDLLIYQKDALVRRVNGNGGYDPIDIERFNNEMVVSDNYSMRLLRYSMFGSEVGEFGDQAFRNELAHLKWMREIYKILVKLAQGLMFLFGFAAIAVAILDRKQKNQVAA